MTPLLILENGREHPVQQVIEKLHKVGLRVSTSFDSRHTRREAANILCPHHGTAVCNCHMVVLLVYETEGHPATLIGYGQDDEFWVSLTYPPGLRPSATLQSQIATALKPALLPISPK